MGKRIVKAAKYAVAVAAWLAAHTSFATETINATGGAGGAASASAISASGAVAGSSANGGAQTVNGGSTRAYGLGMSAAVSPNACDSAIGWGFWPWENNLCALQTISRHLHNMGQENAAVLVMCQDRRARLGLTQAGYVCPAELASRMPVFQTGAEGANGYDAYNPYQYAK